MGGEVYLRRPSGVEVEVSLGVNVGESEPPTGHRFSVYGYEYDDGALVLRNFATEEEAREALAKLVQGIMFKRAK